MKVYFALIAIAAVSLLGITYIIRADSSVTETASQQPVVSEEEAPTEKTCLSDECLKIEDLEYPVSELPTGAIQALSTAIDDEYKAHAVYEAVIEQLGSTRPFSMIIRAEENHISSLKSLFDKYGIDVPVDPYANLEVASTRSENCSIGVQAEIDNAVLYRDNLLTAVADYPDIVRVFENLMNASQDKHLPAFQKCAG